MKLRSFSSSRFNQWDLLDLKFKSRTIDISSFTSIATTLRLIFNVKNIKMKCEILNAVGYIDYSLVLYVFSAFHPDSASAFQSTFNAFSLKIFRS